MPLPFPVQRILTQTIVGPATKKGRIEWMTVSAGQNASLCHSTDATEFMTQLIAEAETAFSKYWELFLLCERQEMRMKHDESAEFPGCSSGCGVRSCNSCSRGRGEAKSGRCGRRTGGSFL